MPPSILPADYTDAEKKLVELARRGGVADYRTGKEELDDPAKGVDWGLERTIRAEVIYALAVGDNPQVHAKGVRIVGAKIDGPLDLAGAQIPHLLALGGCFIGERIILRDADALSVNLTGSRVAGIGADGLRTRGSVFLRDGFHATGEVRLVGAKIGGQLDCSGGTFENADGFALNLQRANVAQGLLLRELSSPPTGVVYLAYSQVGELIDGEESWPENEKLILDGFVYGRIAGDAPWRASDRLRWLGLQPGFWP
jgi:hypothetical protein